MKKIQHVFARGTSWYAAESLYYRLLYTTHTLLLYSLIDSKSFGYIGTLFSSVYLVISLLDFGLVKSWGPFFGEASKSKAEFKRMMWYQGLIHIMCMSMGLLLFSVGFYFFSHYISWPKAHLFLWILLSIIFFCEGIKILLKALLQLAFFFKETAIAEIITITAFFIAVWSGYGISGQMGPEHIFGAMSIASMLGLMYLVYHSTMWYSSLPNGDQNNSFSGSLFGRLFKNRIAIYCNSLFGTVIFSSNFLVPIIAFYGGFEYISTYKLMSNLTHSVSLIIQHIFLPTSTSILAHLKNNTLQEKRDAFQLLTQHLYQLLLGVIIFLLINNQNLLKITKISMPIMLFFFIIFTENFFITYTSFYITQERPHYLLLCNIVPFFLCCVAWKFIASSLLMVLLFLVCARVASLFCLSFFCYYLWNIKPSLFIRPRYLGLSVVVSCLFYVFSTS